MLRSLALVALFASSAHAAADIDVSLQAPAGVQVYDQARYTIRVDNIGNKNASSVKVYVQLPETQTSPTVHVMGIVGTLHRKCSQSGSILTCDFGKVRKNRSKTRWFEIALPVSATPLDFIVEGKTTSNENSTANNALSHTATLDYYDTPIAGPVNVHNEHCTGQGLIGFYECTLFPSSISSHDVVFEANGTITFTNAPGYTGAWNQVLPDRLSFAYYNNGQLVAGFHGYGVPGDCFEGLTLFPGSQWRAPYQVCLQ